MPRLPKHILNGLRPYRNTTRRPYPRSSSSSLDPTQTSPGSLPKTLPDLLSPSQKSLQNISQHPGDLTKTCQHYMPLSCPLPTCPKADSGVAWAEVGRWQGGGHGDAHFSTVLAAPAVPPAVPPTMPPSCQALLDAQALPELPKRNWALSQACAPYQHLCPPEEAQHTCTPLSAQLCLHRLQECREWAPALPLAPPIQGRPYNNKQSIARGCLGFPGGDMEHWG